MMYEVISIDVKTHEVVMRSSVMTEMGLSIFMRQMTTLDAQEVDDFVQSVKKSGRKTYFPKSMKAFPHPCVITAQQTVRF